LFLAVCLLPLYESVLKLGSGLVASGDIRELTATGKNFDDYPHTPPPPRTLTLANDDFISFNCKSIGIGDTLYIFQKYRYRRYFLSESIGIAILLQSIVNNPAG